MVASAPDRAALIFETNSKSTAVFADNDPREATATIDDKGAIVRGAPLPQVHAPLPFRRRSSARIGIHAERAVTASP